MEWVTLDKTILRNEQGKLIKAEDAIKQFFTELVVIWGTKNQLIKTEAFCQASSIEWPVTYIVVNPQETTGLTPVVATVNNNPKVHEVLIKQLVEETPGKDRLAIKEALPTKDDTDFLMRKGIQIPKETT